MFSYADFITACKLVFLASEIGSRSLSSHMDMLKGSNRRNPELPDLRRIISIGSCKSGDRGVETQPYSTFVSTGQPTSIDKSAIEHEESAIRPEDVLNLQFTSGKSGVLKLSRIPYSYQFF